MCSVIPNHFCLAYVHELHLSNGDVTSGQSIRMENNKLIIKTPYAGDDKRPLTLGQRWESEKEIFSPEANKEITITISIGVTEYIPGERISALVERADKAMYISKENGRNRISALFK